LRTFSTDSSCAVMSSGAVFISPPTRFR
jgi:hypothetical protein